MALPYLRKLDRSGESVADLVWTSVTQVTLPASTLLIGDDVYSNSSSVVFDFANGTGNNGLDTGAEATNTWYALYAVPHPSVANQYMLKASVSLPASMGGAGPTGFPSYRYLGLIRNGDGAGGAATGDILLFTQVGAVFQIHQKVSGTEMPGVGLVQAAAATQAEWSLLFGTSGQRVPVSGMMCLFNCNGVSGATNLAVETRTSGGVATHLGQSNGASGFNQPEIFFWWTPNTLGSVDRIRVRGSASDTLTLRLSAWVDPALISGKVN